MKILSFTRQKKISLNFANQPLELRVERYTKSLYKVCNMLLKYEENSKKTNNYVAILRVINHVIDMHVYPRSDLNLKRYSS